ncbi:sll0787 family AIR synthase-like protein [Flagellatimonas centrodinii]|uniref:sll0787 family AIR synthase-like protein n=1 Tax=Flagellatimonas centrodinii TaxID=2806210 RepID=UPI001FEDD67A|nr:sll0787 family AIR synthase-like protein [Flagellatimonas centrodinii]ULQ47070.1 sll0787 family AIR synthase-like protein [Flagellatimonas centrodinii]
MSAPDLNDLVAALREGNGVAHKRDIAAVVGALGIGGDSAIAVGDDCAAIAQPGAAGHLLLAIEGFIPHFVEADPWFAGWCGVMVNVSDVYAMGGRPTAIVNALWGRGDDRTGRLLDGMRAAARCYQVPMVGGHSNLRCEEDQLAVAILGHATRLLTSFDARPGDRLLVALDLRGAYRPPFAHWNCTTDVDPARLRADLDLLPMLAEAGLCRSAKDISQAGVLGTLMMLMECSGVGARIAVDNVPRPPGVDPLRWLTTTFPSYGFVMAVNARHCDAVIRCFADRGLVCADVGCCDDSAQLHVERAGASRLAWDFTLDALTGCAPNAHKEALDA